MKKKKIKIKILNDENNYLNYFFQEKESDFYGHKFKMINANVLLYCIFLQDVYWKYDKDKQLFFVISKEDGNIIKTFTKENWSNIFKKYTITLNIEKMILICPDIISEPVFHNLLTLFEKLKIEYKFIEDNLDKILSDANLNKLDEL